MANTVSTKKVTDLPENTEVKEDDLFIAGANGTASLRKIKFSSVLSKIRQVLLANNRTTTEEGYALDARQGKEIQEQIDELNTNINKKYERIFATSNVTGAGIIENFQDYSEYVISISAAGFITNHYATPEMLIGNPVFASSYYHSGTSHSMATISIFSTGQYQIAQGIDQNSPSSSIAVYAR